MKCPKCGTENKEEASFCVNCGSKLEVGANIENINSNTNINMNTQAVNNNNLENQKKNKWLFIGIPVAILVILIIAISGSGDNIGTAKTDGRTKLGNYLVSIGYTKNSNTKYTMYNGGYTYTFDFTDALMSIENSNTYAAYYYKKNTMGIALTSNGTTIAIGYNFDTATYSCNTKPSTYETYLCNYVKSSAINLANTSKNSFNSIISSAGVSLYDL